MLLLVIALVLGIMFYDYIPNNKTVPTALKQYELAPEAQEELNETMSRSSENIVKTYYIEEKKVKEIYYSGESVLRVKNYDKQ